MITPYYGEFLIIPMPLELSVNRCSNGCHYCFSNLNGYKAKRSIQSILNHLQKFPNRNDPASVLLKEKRPICLSNRTDPFALSNYRDTIKIVEICTALDIDIAYQTKGGKGIDEVLSFAKPAIWYITICQDDDVLRKKIEPGTISIKERLKLIEKLVDHGHLVNVGINPFVPEWIKDKKTLVKDIKTAGCYGITVEGFHFSHEQIRRMNVKAVGEEIVARASKKKPTDFELSEYKKLCDIIKSVDLDLWSFYNWERSDFWEPYYDRYNCFPILTNFTNYVFDNMQDGDIITFKEFKSVMTGIPNRKFKIDSYIMSINRAFKNENIPINGTGTELLKIFWSEPRLNTCPANHPCLSIVADKTGKNEVSIKGQLPTLMFRKKGFTSTFVTDQGEEIK